MMREYILAALKNQKGQTMVELALILVLISIAAIAVLQLMGPQVAGIFQQISNAL